MRKSKRERGRERSEREGHWKELLRNNKAHTQKIMYAL